MKIIKLFTISFMLFIFNSINAQTNLGNTFSGSGNPATLLCPQTKAAFTDEKVNQLIVEILNVSNLKNRFIIMPCSGISNCQAIYYEGKPYILYNAAFLNEIKGLSFSEKDLVVSERNWESLTILAHELGHHFNNHLNNPPPGATPQQLELEADEFAGSTIYMLGGSLIQSQSAFKSESVSESYTHPGRMARLAAVAKGWNDASLRFVNKGGKRIEPAIVSKNYNSMKIASQEWMTENLDVDRFRNGELINEAKSKEEWIAASKKKEPVWCYYDFNEKNKNIYGKFYNGFAILDSRGIAPEGWRIPSRLDFELLLSSSGIKKRTDSYDFKNYSYPNGASFFRPLSEGSWPAGTKMSLNPTGFNALPSGGISYNEYGNYDEKNKKWIGPASSYFFGQGSICRLWSIDKYNKFNNQSMILFGINSDIDDIFIYIDNIFNGYPVRCVKSAEKINNFFR
jgi:uncharacterized protein (TIGR02145 family)